MKKVIIFVVVSIVAVLLVGKLAQPMQQPVLFGLDKEAA